MKQSIVGRTSFLCLSVAAALFLTAPISCKKAAPVDRAVAVFVIGTVTVERPGEGARAVVHKDELRAGDTVATGTQSLLVAQFGAETLIEIEEDSTVRFASISKDGATGLMLERGGVFSRVGRLGKNASYHVQTRTSIAAVRGTEFRVTSGDEGSVVAVSGGTVAVSRPAREGRAVEETKVGEGSAAEVNAKITVRPVSEDEEKEFTRFGKIRPVQNLDSATESDLQRLEDDYRKNSEADENADKKEEKSETVGASGKGVADDPVAAKVRLWTGKQVYASSEPVIVFYRDMPDYRNCWIDISKASDSDGRYRSYNWTYSATSGQMTFSDLGLEPGIYEVRAHFSKSSTVSTRYRFRVR